MRSTGAIVILVLVLIVGFAGCAGCGTYNSLVTQDETVINAWAGVETAYQRRADLIPNLVATVQGAADFEQETLTAVTEARTASREANENFDVSDIDDPAAVQAYLAAQQAVPLAINAVAEAYPQLTATQGFQDLQVQLEGTENRINTARRDYNDAVQRYNSQVRSFPTNIVAGFTGFDRKTPFEADAGAEDAVEVSFD
ncbi:MAG: LemA family protein [Bacteroidota bacterium]